MDIKKLMALIPDKKLRQLRKVERFDEAMMIVAGKPYVIEQGDHKEHVDLFKKKHEATLYAVILCSRIPNNDKFDLIKSWAKKTYPKAGGLHIDESRFMRFSKADNDIDFIEYATVGLRGLAQYRGGISHDSIYEWCQIWSRTVNHDGPMKTTETFCFRASESFYRNQSKSLEASQSLDAS